MLTIEMKTQNALLAERCDQRDGGEDGRKADPECIRIVCDECNTTHAHTMHVHIDNVQNQPAAIDQKDRIHVSAWPFPKERMGAKWISIA